MEETGESHSEMKHILSDEAIFIALSQQYCYATLTERKYIHQYMTYHYIFQYIIFGNKWDTGPDIKMFAHQPLWLVTSHSAISLITILLLGN